MYRGQLPNHVRGLINYYDITVDIKHTSIQNAPYTST